jgi:hypothetical protein
MSLEGVKDAEECNRILNEQISNVQADTVRREIKSAENWGYSDDAIRLACCSAKSTRRRSMIFPLNAFGISDLRSPENTGSSGDEVFQSKSSNDDAGSHNSACSECDFDFRIDGSSDPSVTSDDWPFDSVYSSSQVRCLESDVEDDEMMIGSVDNDDENTMELRKEAG